MNILHIDSCALGDNSTARRSTAAAVARLAAIHRNARIQYRDLAAAPLSHVSGPLLQVMSDQWDAAIPMNAELRAETLLGASLLREFLDADIVVVGAAMYNFSMPSTLKAWLDRLLQLRKHVESELGTNPDSERGVGKRLLLMTASCSDVNDPSTQELMSRHETLLKAAFNHIGFRRIAVARSNADLDDVQRVWAQASELKTAA